MKKIWRFLLLFMILLLPSFVNAEAVKYLNTNDTINSVGTIEHSYFEAGNTVNDEAIVKGILFSAGNSLNIKGTSEYAFVVGNIINVIGNIENDAFIAGNSVSINNANIGRDLFVAGNDISISTDINGNAFITGSNVNLTNTQFKGNLTISAENVTFGEGASIDGTLKYNDDATITGLKNGMASYVETYSSSNKTTTFYDNLRSAFYFILALTFIAFVINALFPKIYKNIFKKYNSMEMLKEVGIGFLVLISIPILTLMFLLTVLGIPLGLILITLYAIWLYLSIVISSTYIGGLLLNKIFGKEMNSYLVIFVGIILAQLIALIPMIGGIIYFLLMLYGLGISYHMLKKAKQSK